MKPQLIPEQPLPDTPQTTMPLPGPLAKNCTCAFRFTCGELGVRVSFEALAMVTVALEDALGEATDVAVIVTVAGLGTVPGAV